MVWVIMGRRGYSQNVGVLADLVNHWFSNIFGILVYMQQLDKYIRWDWISVSYFIEYVPNGWWCNVSFLVIPEVNFGVRAFKLQTFTQKCTASFQPGFTAFINVIIGRLIKLKKYFTGSKYFLKITKSSHKNIWPWLLKIKQKLFTNTVRYYYCYSVMISYKIGIP